MTGIGAGRPGDAAGRAPGPPDRPVAELSYQDASDELDAIIAELDAGTVDVDRLGERYQRAAEIAEELDRRIRVNRARIEELAPRLERLSDDG